MTIATDTPKTVPARSISPHTHHFTLISSTPLPNLALIVQHYQHPSGLVHYHLASDNKENAFLIGFATHPTSSNGVAHVLEHVVLCGSQKYPVRDPFFSMIKRSLQTFMNAMTASDWTAYPFATQNKSDYFNLLDVYLDAVFFPNLHPLDFAQEGIRIALGDDGKAQYHGIVFNEMKGAMSNEISQLYHAINPHLFADTPYQYNSGGNPADIEQLTHSDLLQFHQSHYHPANAIAMSFGDIDPADTQQKLEQVLSIFARKNLPAQRLFTSTAARLKQPIAVQDTYASDQVSDNATHHVLAWLLPPSADPKQRLAMRLMAGVLIEHSERPLRQLLESTPLGLAPSPLLGLDSSRHEMVFYAGIRGSRPEHGGAFLQEVMDCLHQISSAPVDSDTVSTVLHQMELEERHLGSGQMPFGLGLIMGGFGTAIHGGNPLDLWQIDAHLAWLKTQLQDENWLPQLIKTHLLDNSHRVHMTLIPDNAKAAQQNQAESERLDAITLKLSDADKTALTTQSTALIARTSAQDDINILPKIGLSDIPQGLQHFIATDARLIPATKNAQLHHHSTGTNGLYYYRLLLTLTPEVMSNPLLPLYVYLLGEMGTKEFNARAFSAHQARYSGGVSAQLSLSSTDKNSQSGFLLLATRALASSTPAIDIVRKVLTDTVFNENERIKELLTQKYLSQQAQLSSAGHSYAMQTASRNFSTYGHFSYYYQGLPALKALKQFLDDGDCNQLSAALAHLHAQIQALPKSAILVSESYAQQSLFAAIDASFAHVTPPPDPTPAALPFAFATLERAFAHHHAPPQDSAWLIPTTVYYNAAAFAAVPAGHPDAPALMVLCVFLKNGYLHRAIREQGGAYGGGANFDGNSASLRFYSYRDPHCRATFAHFTSSVAWLLNNDHTSEQLEEAILAIIAAMDKPATPAADAISACIGTLHGRDKTWQEQLRQAVLAVSLDDLKRVSKTYLQNKPCVKACLAPIESSDELAAMGFVIERL